MTDKTYYLIFSEAIASFDKEAFVSDWALSSVFPEDSDIAENAAEVAKIWDVAHVTIKEIRARTGLSQIKFAEHFCIPRRTLENWESGTNSCPPYVLRLLDQVVGR